MDEVARGIPAAPVAERIVPTMATFLEELVLHPGHPLRVKIALELRGEAELAEEVAPGRPVEAGTRHVGHQERHLLALELVVQVEHQPRIAGEAR